MYLFIKKGTARMAELAQKRRQGGKKLETKLARVKRQERNTRSTAP